MERLLDEVIECFSLSKTDKERDRLALMCFCLGAAKFSEILGEAELLKGAFPDIKVPVEENAPEPEQEQNQETDDEHAPDRCPKCRKRVIYNASKSLWVCNCKGYQVSPKPETICPHCHIAVKPQHYYWACDCNRYDCAPDVPANLSKPGEGPLSKCWSSSFPSE